MAQLIQLLKCWNCNKINRLTVNIHKCGEYFCNDCKSSILKQEISKGFIYVLSNPSMEGLLKIGATERTPEERVAELKSTGIPTDFIVVSKYLSKNPYRDEKLVHQLFDEYRVNKQREFFKIDLLTVCNAIEEFCEII